MVLTEKVRMKLGGSPDEGRQAVVYRVSDMAAGANNISAESLGLHQIVHGDFWPEVVHFSTDATSMDHVLSTFEGGNVTVTCRQPSGSGTLMAWGY